MKRGTGEPHATQAGGGAGVRLLDLFCGRWGWARAFAARGWDCFGIDLQVPKEIPERCEFEQGDILHYHEGLMEGFDFIVASSPCQEFSIHGMPHFHPNAKYPSMGIRLFNHTRELCEASGIPYVMENVLAAQWFVGESVNNCGPFHLWGTGVPPLMPQGITKNMSQQRDANGRRRGALEHVSKRERAAEGAKIPPELANCVADYAEALLRDKVAAGVSSAEGGDDARRRAE